MTMISNDVTPTTRQEVVAELSLDKLRLLRARTMLYMAGDRIHRAYVENMLDERDALMVNEAIADLNIWGAPVPTDRLAMVVAGSIDRLADALDADDHVAGQVEVAVTGTTLAAMAILSDWEVGTLSPY